MQLFYRLYGNGKNIIILHGLFEMSDAWVGYAKHWASKYRVIVPDLRNHGFSPHSQEHNSYVMANDLKELMDNLEIEKTILIGYSMGGRVAMNFAQRFENLVEKLIIIDMAPDRYDPDLLMTKSPYMKKMNLILNIDIEKYKTRKELQTYIQKIIDNQRLSGLIMKNIKQNDRKFVWKFNTQALKDYINNLQDYPINVNKKISTPTLFIKAEKSLYINEKQINIIQKIFLNYKLITVQGTTHFLQVERPAQVMKIIDDFISQ